MNLHQIKEHLKELITEHLNKEISSLELTPVGGGSINDAYKVTINGSIIFFLKINSFAKFPFLFEKEKNGLEFISRQNCILTPPVLLCETVNDHQLLLLEWTKPGNPDKNFWKKFGEQLAQLHSVSYEQFGFSEDNYMGSLPQTNTFTKNWNDFFIHSRLQPQTELAFNNKLLQKKHLASFASLFKKTVSLFTVEKPSLLHGDLWSGNFICNQHSLPVLIDPALYFGHRSMDLAMTTLFGGFHSSFYDSYNYHSPLPVNHAEQWELCNLYPLLIHLNLFGSSYLRPIEATLQKFS